MNHELTLVHHGIKGMKWGVRRSIEQLDRASDRKINKMAKKDAKRKGIARQAYGEGAGTQRKLLNKEIETKQKRSPKYKKAYDEALSALDYTSINKKAKRNNTKRAAGRASRKIAGRMAKILAGGVSFAAANAAAHHRNQMVFNAVDIVLEASKRR